MKIKKLQLRKIVLPLLGLLLLFVVVSWSLFKQKSVVCADVKIDLVPEDGTYFLSNTHVLKIIGDYTNKNDLIGKNIKELNTYSMLLNLNNSPYVEKADVFLGHNGQLKVYVKQREPLFRVINQQGTSYYVEKSGLKIPFMPRFSVRVPILTGNIAETLEDSTFVRSETLAGAMKIFEVINDSEFWTAQIEQCHVDKKKGYILIPKVGSHTIVVGKPDDIERKLENVKLFYFQALNKLGWEAYSEINVSFDGQVVAKKRNY